MPYMDGLAMSGKHCPLMFFVESLYLAIFWLVTPMQDWMDQIA